MLRQLALARTQSTHGVSAAHIAESLRADPLQIEPIVDALLRLDWIARLDEGDDPRLVLLADPDFTPAQPLIAALLLDPTVTVRAFWQRAGFQDINLRQLLEA